MFMTKLCVYLGRLISKALVLYYILQFTWGLLANVMGGLVWLVLVCCGRKCGVYRGTLQVQVGQDWGGFSLGIFQVVCVDWTDSLAYHELGHSYQNAWMGPFWFILVAIPSFVRYWYREFRFYRKGKQPPTDYDAIWFEGSATKVGKEIYENSI